ncbi:MAG TPA: phenylphosphate carboxylase subunit delta [Burkholderiales bacterium]|nr:phenylphosphate carboxylase subunit delta [Burkholderiales bacterium]
MAAFDVDGVMTDGSLYYTDAGEEFKAFNVQDGHGIRMLQESGVVIAIITSRTSKLVAHRARNLGIEHLYQGVENKLEAMNTLLRLLAQEPAAASYMGDDVIDLPVLRRCGFAVSVPEAPALVRRHAHYVTRAGGGRGAVREFAEFVMHAQGALDAVLARYLV